jgi:transcriptional adapter 2-alpha
MVLQEARAAGCRNPAEAERYLAQKRRREAEENARRAREGAHVGPNNHGVPNALMSPDSTGTRPAGPANSSSVNQIDLSGYYGADLLSEAVRIFYLLPSFHLKTQRCFLICFLKSSVVIFCQEKRLCCELRMAPSMYLKMQEQLSVQMITGAVTSKSEARQMFKMEDPVKIDRVYDMLIKKGIGSL